MTGPPCLGPGGMGWRAGRRKSTGWRGWPRWLRARQPGMDVHSLGSAMGRRGPNWAARGHGASRRRDQALHRSSEAQPQPFLSHRFRNRAPAQLADCRTLVQPCQDARACRRPVRISSAWMSAAAAISGVGGSGALAASIASRSTGSAAPPKEPSKSPMTGREWHTLQALPAPPAHRRHSPRQPRAMPAGCA